MVVVEGGIRPSPQRADHAWIPCFAFGFDVPGARFRIGLTDALPITSRVVERELGRHANEGDGGLTGTHGKACPVRRVRVGRRVRMLHRRGRVQSTLRVSATWINYDCRRRVAVYRRRLEVCVVRVRVAGRHDRRERSEKGQDRPRLGEPTSPHATSKLAIGAASGRHPRDAGASGPRCRRTLSQWSLAVNTGQMRLRGYGLLVLAGLVGGLVSVESPTMATTGSPAVVITAGQSGSAMMVLSRTLRLKMNALYPTPGVSQVTASLAGTFVAVTIVDSAGQQRGGSVLAKGWKINRTGTQLAFPLGSDSIELRPGRYTVAVVSDGAVTVNLPILSGRSQSLRLAASRPTSWQGKFEVLGALPGAPTARKSFPFIVEPGRRTWLLVRASSEVAMPVAHVSFCLDGNVADALPMCTLLTEQSGGTGVAVGTGTEDSFTSVRLLSSWGSELARGPHIMEIEATGLGVSTLLSAVFITGK